jgi:hypothetical protein
VAERPRAAGPLCPSAQPEAPGAVLVGVVGGSVQQPRVQFLGTPVPVTAELLELTAPVSPGEVLRVAAPCLGSGCRHFADRQCALAAKVTRLLPEVSEELPDCAIRPDCRWFGQEGGAACRRCPQVIREDVRPSPAMRVAADPAVPASAAP